MLFEDTKDILYTEFEDLLWCYVFYLDLINPQTS